jgi:hypothetical protein
MSGGYAVAQLDDIEELSDGRAPMRPVRHHLGITAFGVNAWTGKEAGDRIINEHEEREDDGDTQEELYIVQSGRARFEIDGNEIDAPAGSFVFVKPNTKRTAFAEEAGTTIVVVGGSPGEAFQPFGWEIWMPIHRLYLEGDYEGASDAGRVAAESGMPYAGVFYNLACCESLAGRTGDAIDHLGRSIEMSDRFREMAKQDTDFDPIRSEPAFEELVAG